MELDWTHRDVKITDVRKINKLYVLTVDQDVGNLLVSDQIFSERLESYFLKSIDRIDRRDILDTKWNMHITKGYYVKIVSQVIPLASLADPLSGNVPTKIVYDLQKHPGEEERWYVSYLEIAGELGEFENVIKNKKNG